VWHVWERREMNTGFWWGNMKERDHVEDIRRRWEENIKTGWEDVGWIRLVGEGTSGGLFTNTVVNLNLCIFNRVPHN
jgi:hypothetical protein